MIDHISVLEKVIFDNGQPVKWLRSWDKGQSWQEVDCSMLPDGRPLFVILNPSPELAYVIEERWLPKTEFTQVTGTMVNKEVTS
jgi:hypothetical protein